MRFSRHRSLRTLALGAMLWARPLVAQPLPGEVALEPPIECWYHDAFPELAARFGGAGIGKSRLYFRCSLYPDYYFVDLEETAGGSYRGVGPMAEESCPSVSYYVEAVTQDFESFRTPERIAEVTDHDSCRRRFPGAAMFSGDPGIVLGAVSSASERMAPGFKLLGIRSFLTAAGESAVAGTGGAGGAVTPVVVAGVAATGAGVVLAATSSGEEVSHDALSEPSPPSGEISEGSSPPTGGASSPAVRACFDTDPANATIEAGESIRLDARCSTGTNLVYRWDLGDGRRREGAFISPIYRDPGTFTVTLEVTQPDGSSVLAAVDRFSREVTVEAPPAPLVACFTATVLNPGTSCDMKFEAVCSVGDIVSYDWILDETNVMGAGAYPDTGVQVVHDWTGYPGCATTPPWPTISVRLTVTDRDGRTHSVAKSVQVQFLGTRSLLEQGSSSFVSELTTGGTGEGRLRIDGEVSSTTAGAGRVLHALRGAGPHRVEATLLGEVAEPGAWRFDFRGTAGFVPGSIRVSGGHVLVLDSHSVVFRLSGTSGETLSFTYRIGE